MRNNTFISHITAEIAAKNSIKKRKLLLLTIL